MVGAQSLQPQRSFATQLLGEGVPVAAGFRYLVADQDAAEFDMAFYTALRRGRPGGPGIRDQVHLGEGMARLGLAGAAAREC